MRSELADASVAAVAAAAAAVAQATKRQGDCEDPSLEFLSRTGEERGVTLVVQSRGNLLPLSPSI
jgi:hypothetical protein